jgi:iron complex outermembrane receptor protein
MKTASVRGRRRALAIAIALCNGLGAAGAWGESEVEEVVVTGSRIKSASVYAPQPISTITSETIVQSGQPDITEILNDNPALLSSVSSSNSIDAPASNVGDVGAVGGASLNLRGLGIERTLTVVNGQRSTSRGGH